MTISSLIIIFIASACWGSFLNAMAMRMLNHDSLTRRSRCPHCHTLLSWHDLIPLFSWLRAAGSCRHCKRSISWWYPSMELMTAVTFTAAAIFIPWPYLPVFLIFFSSLLITIRTDTAYLLILRWPTLGLIPLALAASLYKALPITLYDSIFGIFVGYGILTFVSTIYTHATQKVGLGDGDAELLALIGAFLGPIGCWITLTGGSFLGSLVGISLYYTPFRLRYLPFGTFLASSAIIYTIGSFIYYIQ